MGGDAINGIFNDGSDTVSDDDGGDKEQTGREHYVSVDKSQLRSKSFLMDDPKYKGKKISRKEALELDSEEEDQEEEEVREDLGEGQDDDDDNEVEDDQDDEDESDDSSDEGEEDQDQDMASDDLDDGEDLMASLDRNGSEDDEEDDEDDDSKDDDNDKDSDEDEDGDEEDGYGDFSRSGITETSEDVRKELLKIQQDEKELLQSMTKSATDDVEKGVHVKAQMVSTTHERMHSSPSQQQEQL